MENLAKKMRFIANIANENILDEYLEVLSKIEETAKQGYFDLSIKDLNGDIISRLKMMGFDVWAEEEEYVIAW